MTKDTEAADIAKLAEVAEGIGLPPHRLSALAYLLANFPSDGKPRDREAQIDALLLGFIEKREITKPCASCGTARPDYSYFKITPAGKLFSAAVEALNPLIRDTPHDG
jgi:hypothetical protein